MKGNWFERTLGTLAPTYALKRAMAQTALQSLRGYDGARVTPRTASWRAPATAASAEIAYDGKIVRARARDLVRNNPYATKVHNTLLNNVISTGITGVPKGKKWRQIWTDWQDECDFEGLSDFAGLQNMAGASLFESGDVLIRYITVASSSVPAGITPLKLQVMEPDFIDTTRMGILAGGGFVDRGIEYDKMGRRVAYWIYDHHPGDVAMFRLRSLQSSRVPASEIRHIFNRMRPGQDRGISLFAPVIMRLRDLDSYFEAELTRKRIEACLSVFVTTLPDEDGDPLKKVIGTADSSDPERRERLEPGMVEYLQHGENISVAAPAAGLGFGDYAKTYLQGIASGCGVMYEHMTGDYSGVNYSSYRAGNFEFRRLVERLQWLTIIPMALKPTANEFRRHAIAAGLGPVQTPPAFTWATPKFISVDPFKDAQANEKNLRLGIERPSTLVEGNGYTYAEHLEGLKADMALSDSIVGAQFDGDPRKAVNDQKGQGNAQTADPAKPAA
jgi:lambda family phage portal protein